MKPGRVTGGVAALAGLVSIGATGVTTLATVAGLLGLALLVGGVVFGRPTGIALGGLGLASAVPLAGLADASVGALVVGVGAAALAYDLGDESIETRRTFEADAPTARGEAVHALGAGLLVALAGGGAFLLYRLTSSRGSTLAVAALLVGATALTAAVRFDE